MTELNSGSRKNSEEYITLFQASKLCPYSEPYLRLRARQGKFKSIKFGKKWMTTAQWIEDYMEKTKKWNERIAAKKNPILKNGNNMPVPEAYLSKAETESAPVLSLAQPIQVSPKEEVKQATREKEVLGSQTLDLALIVGSGLMFAGLIFFAVAADESFLNLAPRNPQANLRQASLENIAGQPVDECANSQGFVCQIPGSSIEDGRELPPLPAIEAKQDPLRKLMLEAVVAINNFRFPWEAR